MQGKIAGDIIPFTLDNVSRAIPKHDLLAAGFPCQPFSKSGNQLGISEARGTLFYNIAKILEAKKPKYFVLENVRNLVGPQHKHTWALIIRILRDIGYRVSEIPTIYSPHLIPPELGGSPQVRDRVYIVGIYVGPKKSWQHTDDDFYMPYKPQEGWSVNKWNLEKHLLQKDSEVLDIDLYKLSDERRDVIDTWQDFIAKVGKKNGEKILPGFPLWEKNMTVRPSLTLDMPDWKIDFLKKNSAFYVENKKGIDAWRKRYPDLKQLNNSYRKFEWQAQDLGSIWSGVIQFRPSGVRVKKPDYLPALVAMNQTSIIGSKRRTITVREAARLQAFPETFTFGDQNPAQSFKQLGNAVSVGTVKFVLTSILNDLNVKL
jgi:DNA (cytosine-5)-methyltransferase 1